ncbi:MAG: hypothetical protein ABI821_04130 [Pseudomonadota bacterium]
MPFENEARLAQFRSSRGALLMGSAILIGLFTLLSGFGDAEGFVHANRIWHEGRFVWGEALRSLAGFQFGMIMFWLALWKLGDFGVVTVETQTLFWFVATIIGVALLSGRILRWPAVDQAVSVGVLAGLAWLMYRGAR